MIRLLIFENSFFFLKKKKIRSASISAFRISLAMSAQFASYSQFIVFYQSLVISAHFVGHWQNHRTLLVIGNITAFCQSLAILPHFVRHWRYCRILLLIDDITAFCFIHRRYQPILLEYLNKITIFDVFFLFLFFCVILFHFLQVAL